MKKPTFKERIEDILNKSIERMNEKNASFKARQEKLEEKYKTKKVNRLYKMQMRAKYEYKWLGRFVQLSILGVTGLFLYGAYQNVDEIQAKYVASSEWEKADTTKISSIPTELLYLDETMRETSLEYIRFQDELYNIDKGDFRRGVSEDDIDNLNKMYDGLDDVVKESVKKTHDEINTNYTVLTDYYDIVSQRDKKTIKSSATTKDIQTFIIDHTDTVINQLLLDGEHEFAKNMRENMFKLSEDSSRVEDLYGRLLDVFTFKNGKSGLEVNLNAKAEDDWLVNLSDYRNGLHYNWKVLTGVLPNIYKKSEDDLKKTKDNRVKYEAYEKDLSDKESFEAFNGSYNKAVDSLNASIIDLPDFEKMNFDELEKWVKDNNMKLELRKIETDNERLDNKVTLDVALSDYKRILEGSTIEGILYEYVESEDDNEDDEIDDEDEDEIDDEDEDEDEDKDDESSTDSRSTNRR